MPISRVDTAKLKQREEERVRKLVEQEAKKGKGVSEEGQRLFDALDRMYVVLHCPILHILKFSSGSVDTGSVDNWNYVLIHYRYATRWHGTDIIVADAVIVSPPYNGDSCKAPKEKAQVLAQIKKVVDGERKKMERARGVSPVPPRKGG